MTHPVDPKGFIQINIVVRDIAVSAAKWAELLGIPVPEIRRTRLEGGTDYEYRGRRVSCELLTCNIAMPGFVLELHQPAGGPSTFQEFMERHGAGVHHLGFEVGDRRDAVVEELEREGYGMRTLGVYPGSSWTILDSEDVLGVNLNIKPVR